MLKIKFINTGYETYMRQESIFRGNIKDYFYPAVAGIGYLGESFKTYKKDKELYKSLKTRWNSMIYRCYKKDDPNYPRYGELGIIVDERWHNFSNFLEDATNLPGFNRDDIVYNRLQLDKDILQKDIFKYNKIYSKDTCCWATAVENNATNVDYY